MNYIFAFIVFVSFTIAGYRELTWTSKDGMPSPMESLSAEIITTAGSAVTLAIGLIGVMALFLGLMKVAESGGLLVIIAKVVRPLMVRLFPDVPENHPAMGAMILNISANALGLGNAATPFGIRAMQALDTLNPQKGEATNAMALFLAINTSSVTLLPTGVIALRAAAGSNDPAGILPTTLFATVISTAIAITSAKILQRYWPYSPALPSSQVPGPDTPENPDAQAFTTSNDKLSPPLDQKLPAPYPLWVSLLTLVMFLSLIPVSIYYGTRIAPWIIPALVVLLLGFGICRRVPVYEVFVEGAKEGFQVALRIIPYLVAILVAVGMLRASGTLELLIHPLGHITTPLGLPADALPMALLRPLSGSGAYGILASIIQDPSIGPDSYTGYLVSTFQGSTETTFYVLAVYFGAIQIRRIRHTLIAALLADIAGITAAIFIVSLMYG